MKSRQRRNSEHRSRPWSPATSYFPLIRDFRLLFWSDLNLRSARTYAPHAHPHHQLTIVVSGQCRVMVGDKWLAGRSGHCFYIPAGTRHSFEIIESPSARSSSEEYRAIQFRFQIPQEASHSIRAIPSRIDLSDRSGMIQRAHEAREKVSGRSKIDRMLGHLGVIELLLLLSRDFGAAPRSDSASRAEARQEIEQTVATIHARFSDPTITVSSLAEQCGLSMSRFSHLFSETLGIGPMAYLREVRLSRAQELLSSPDDRGGGSASASVSEVARRVGYASHHYFSRDFRKRLGLAPSEYRARANGTIV